MSVATAAPTNPRRGNVPTQRPAAEKSPVGGLLTSLVLGGVPAIILAIAAVKVGITNNPYVVPLLIVTFFANAMIILKDIRHGLALFILTAGISPKLPGLYNNLRVEDFIFVLVVLGWFMKRSSGARMPKVQSPIVTPFLALTVMSLVSTVYGAVHPNYVPDLKYSFFLQIKRIEYFMIFYVVVTTIRSEAWLRALTVCFVASGALGAMYGLANPASAHDQSVADMRVTGPEGENYNTLAGYLVVCIGAGLGALPGFKGLPRLLIIAFTSISLLGVLFSFSREGYIMLLGSMVVFAFTKHRWIFLVIALVMGSALTLPGPIRANLDSAVNQIQKASDDDPGSNSLTARYRAWDYRWNGWFMKEPLIGCGVGSVALSVDNEYLMRACEVGVVGFSLFVWWLASIAFQVKQLQRAPGLPRSLATGLAAAFVGLLIQGYVAASFTSIRTMEPFWFLLGLVTVAVTLYHRDRAAAQQAAATTREAAAAADPKTAPSAPRPRRPIRSF